MCYFRRDRSFPELRGRSCLGKPTNGIYAGSPLSPLTSRLARRFVLEGAKTLGRSQPAIPTQR